MSVHSGSRVQNKNKSYVKQLVYHLVHVVLVRLIEMIFFFKIMTKGMKEIVGDEGSHKL